MSINYKKCPRCNSLNVIRILYGMPNHALFLMVEEGKIKLGGCCITRSDPEYFCKDCENEWHTQTAIENAYTEIKGIKVSVGGYFGGYYEVDLDFPTKKLKWSHLGDGAENKYDKTIRQSSLDNFIESLKVMDILNWKSKYIEPGICDGTHWSLEIIKNGRNIRKYGNNKFPDEWDKFCKLISTVSGKEFR